MKRIWRNKEGVSPVIATILMVAITVVLAAVLYVMVSGYMTGGGGTPLAGSFTKDSGSTPNSGNATLRLAITTPSAPAEANIVVKLLDANDDVIVECAGVGTDTDNDFTLTWKHIATSTTDDTYETGDKLQITNVVAPFVAQDLSGCKISMTVDGYSGTVEYVFD